MRDIAIISITHIESFFCPKKIVLNKSGLGVPAHIVHKDDEKSSVVGHLNLYFLCLWFSQVINVEKVSEKNIV